MILTVMHLVTDDGNYSYACKVDLEKIDLRDGKWAGELLHDCLLKAEKSSCIECIALPGPDRRQRLERVLRFTRYSGWSFSVVSARSYTLVHKSSSRR